MLSALPSQARLNFYSSAFASLVLEIFDKLAKKSNSSETNGAFLRTFTRADVGKRLTFNSTYKIFKWFSYYLYSVRVHITFV